MNLKCCSPLAVVGPAVGIGCCSLLMSVVICATPRAMESMPIETVYRPGLAAYEDLLKQYQDLSPSLNALAVRDV